MKFLLHTLLKILSVLWLVCSWLTGNAQVEVITIDTTTHVPSKPLPFNRSFVLKLLANQKEYPSIYLVEHVHNKTLSETIEKKTVKYVVKDDTLTGDPVTVPVSVTFQPTIIDPSYYYTDREGEKNYLYIQFRDTLTLKPSKLYSLIISTDPDEAVLSIIDILHKASSVTGSDEPSKRKKAKLISKAMSSYSKIAEGIHDKLGIYWTFIPMFYADTTLIDTIPISDIDADGVVQQNTTNQHPETFDLIKKTINGLINFHKKNTEPLCQKIDAERTLHDAFLMANTADLKPGLLGANLSLLNKLYTRIDTLANSKLRDLFAQGNNRALRVLNRLLLLEDIEAKNVLGGYQPLLCDFCKPADATAYDTRMKNIKETITDIEQIQFLTQVLASQEQGLPATGTYFKTALLAANNSYTSLKGMAGNLTKIRTAINNESLFRGAEVTNGTTFIFSFESRTKLSLVPEVGLVSNLFFKSGQSTNYTLIPYVGASVNFSQLDRDVPFKLIRNKTLAQRLSFMVGYSVVPLKDDNVNNPRDDFFEKSSLLTGFGFRFSNTVKAIGGCIWFYNRPANITESRTLTSMPYLGISFDLDIKKYIETIFSAVTPLRIAKAVETKTNE